MGPKAPDRERTEAKPDRSGTEAELRKESVKEDAQPKTLPRPLRDQLADYDPTPDDLVLVRSLLDLAARERDAFLARSYAAFARALDTLGGSSPASSEREKSFRAWHLDAARALADLAQFAVTSRLNEITTPGRAVSVVIRDGQAVAGEVKEADAQSILIAAAGGDVRVRLVNLAPSNFTGNAERRSALPPTELRDVLFDWAIYGGAERVGGVGGGGQPNPGHR